METSLRQLNAPAFGTNFAPYQSTLCDGDTCKDRVPATGLRQLVEAAKSFAATGNPGSGTAQDDLLSLVDRTLEDYGPECVHVALCQLGAHAKNAQRQLAQLVQNMLEHPSLTPPRGGPPQPGLLFGIPLVVTTFTRAPLEGAFPLGLLADELAQARLPGELLALLPKLITPAEATRTFPGVHVELLQHLKSRLCSPCKLADDVAITLLPRPPSQLLIVAGLAGTAACPGRCSAPDLVLGHAQDAVNLELKRRAIPAVALLGEPVELGESVAEGDRMFHKLQLAALAYRAALQSTGTLRAQLRLDGGPDAHATLHVELVSDDASWHYAWPLRWGRPLESLEAAERTLRGLGVACVEQAAVAAAPPPSGGCPE